MSTKLILSTSAAYIAARKVIGDYRKVFDSVDDAITAIRAVFATKDFPADFPVVAAKVGIIDFTEDGTIPPTSEWGEGIYALPGTRVAVSFIGVRGIETGELNAKGEPKVANGAKGFAIYPLFNFDAINENESGGNWLWKLVEKEMSHVAFRNLRGVPLDGTVEQLGIAAKSMPGTVADYVEATASESADSSAFDDMWQNFRKHLKADSNTAMLAEALPGKAEVIKCIRSKAYALESFADLEKMGAFTFIANSMVTLIGLMNEQLIAAGEPTVDAGEIAGWLTKRDSFVFPTQAKKEVDPGAVNFAGFMANMSTQFGAAKTE